jgi:cardiolipin synthase
VTQPPASPEQLATTQGESRRVLEALLGVPFTEGNQVDVLRNGEEIFPAWLEEIGRATRSIDLLSYLWGKGPVTQEVADALAVRARAGVRVRVLLDALGSKGIDRSQLAGMRSAGAEVLFYRPLSTWRMSAMNRRAHGRALVCDEQVAFTGGTGIDRAWEGDGVSRGDWRDNSFRVRGPAVDGIRGAFTSYWVQSPKPLVTDHDQFPGQPQAGSAAVQVLRPSTRHGWGETTVALIALLHAARHRVRIATPYARLPARLLELVEATSQRGVQVQLMLPGPHVDHPFGGRQGDDQHERLMDAGVEIWRYQPSMLHSKVVTVDGSMAMVGSANIDARSLALNEQVQVLISDAATTAVLDGHYDEDLAHSRRTDADQWRQRGTRQRLVDAVAHAAGRPLRGLGSAGLTGRRP